MNIDTSSYYPRSPLEPDGEEGITTAGSLFKEPDDEVRTHEDNPGSPEPPKKPLGISDPEPIRPSWARALDAAATFLSWAMVPLLMPVYGILLIFNLTMLRFSPEGPRLQLIAVAFGFNVVLPMLLIFLLKRLGYISDVGLNKREERPIPYIVTFICMGATAAFFAIKGAPVWIDMFFAGGALAGLISLIINFRWKISAHAAGVAGIVALMIRVCQMDFIAPEARTWLLLSIAAAGLLGAARIWQERHTLAQVLAGFANGFCCVFFLTMIH